MEMTFGFSDLKPRLSVKFVAQSQDLQVLDISFPRFWAPPLMFPETSDNFATFSYKNKVL